MIKEKIDKYFKLQDDIIIYYKDEVKKLKNEVLYLENMVKDKKCITCKYRNYVDDMTTECTCEESLVRWIDVEHYSDFYCNKWVQEKKENNIVLTESDINEEEDGDHVLTKTVINEEEQKEKVRKKLNNPLPIPPYYLWIDPLLSGFKLYRKLRGGVWYQHRIRKPWITCYIYGHKEVWWDRSWIESRDVIVIHKEDYNKRRNL